MFNETKWLKSELNNAHNLILIDLESFSVEDIDFIKQNLPQIFDGRTTKKDLKASAQYMLKLFSNWDKKQVHGAVAEFILICILRHHNFTQEYCFQNLEENSMKKGFDGLFLDKSEEMWLSESKSSYTDTTHCNNLNKGYKHINDNVTGVSSSDAWKNAYNHSRIVNSIDSLQKKLSDLSDAYLEGKFTSIDEYNVILSSTVFCSDIDSVERSKGKIEEWISNHKSKVELAVIITTESVKKVKDILKGIINE